MKKVIVTLLSILILVLSIRLIVYLLDYVPELALDKGTSVIDDEDLYNYGVFFKTYSIKSPKYFSYEIDALKIKYDNETLTINDKVINDVTSVYNYFSIYDNTLLVISYTTKDDSLVLIYNYKNMEEREIKKYKNMILDNEAPITFDDDGITLNYTSIMDNNFIKSGKSICSSKNKDIDVCKTIFYEYDHDTKNIKNSKEIYNMSLLTYINKHNSCS